MRHGFNTRPTAPRSSCVAGEAQSLTPRPRSPAAAPRGAPCTGRSLARTHSLRRTARQPGTCSSPSWAPCKRSSPPHPPSPECTCMTRRMARLRGNRSLLRESPSLLEAARNSVQGWFLLLGRTCSAASSSRVTSASDQTVSLPSPCVACAAACCHALAAVAAGALRASMSRRCGALLRLYTFLLERRAPTPRGTCVFAAADGCAASRPHQSRELLLALRDMLRPHRAHSRRVSRRGFARP